MGSGGFGFVVSPVLMLLIALVVALMLVGGVWMMLRSLARTSDLRSAAV